MSRHTGGGLSPKWVTFSPKILKHRFHFGQKILRGSHFTKFAKKKKNIQLGPLAVFDTEKPLQMGLNLRRFRENCLFISAVLFFFLFFFLSLSFFFSEKNP